MHTSQLRTIPHRSFLTTDDTPIAPELSLSVDWPSSALQSHSLRLVPTPTPALPVAVSEADLQRHAELLASQLQHDVHVAVGHQTPWYQEHMVAGASFADAAYLRMLTMIVCREHRDLVTERAEFIGRSPVLDEMRKAERLTEFWFALAVVVFVFVAGFAWMASRPGERDLPDSAPAHSTMQVQL